MNSAAHVGLQGFRVLPLSISHMKGWFTPKNPGPMLVHPKTPVYTQKSEGKTDSFGGQVSSSVTVSVEKFQGRVMGEMSIVFLAKYIKGNF